MRTLTLILSFLLSGTTGLLSQEELNAYDAQDKRHGVWKKYYPNSKQLRYTGEFEHGKEVGTFKFYCQDCGDQPDLVKEFEANSDRAFLSYYSKGQLISKGEMRGKEKAGTWIYYHKDGQTPMTEENYTDNYLQGLKITYYANGNKTEVVNYSQGKREGESSYYSPAGVKIKHFTYKNDMLHGAVKYFDAKGQLLVSGNYKEDAKHGLWQYFEAGKLVKEERFPKPNGQK